MNAASWKLSGEQPAAAISARISQNYWARWLRWLLRGAGCLVVALAVLLVSGVLPVQAIRVPSDSMTPTISAGDHLLLERDAMALCTFAHQRHRVGQRRGEVERRRLQLHATGLDLRQIQDVVDEREQVPARRVDVLEVIVLLFVELAEHSLEQHFRKADDRVERVRSSCGHVGQKFRLVLVGDL
jgi:hypothetical protein